jgi:hypothetical protein
MGGMAIWQPPDEGEAVGRAHSGDIVPNGAGGPDESVPKVRLKKAPRTKSQNAL